MSEITRSCQGLAIVTGFEPKQERYGRLGPETGKLFGHGTAETAANAGNDDDTGLGHGFSFQSRLGLPLYSSERIPRLKTSYCQIPAYVTKDGSEMRELIHPVLHGGQHQSLAEASVPPGSRTQLHRHRMTDEIYHVTAGKLAAPSCQRRLLHNYRL